ncbi:MAG: site-2 protease family protein [Caldisericia bacterium]|nr:site-2 protease family protein [Caldisericia bacterium]MDD4614244.1 site-2 protease family protein [Caldisericia bacterium]
MSSNAFVGTFLNFMALLICLTVHEFSHAWVAHKLGDPTAEQSGRLTLNPFKHLDPMGTIMLLLFRFGWAKPVPINPYYFKNKKQGIVLTSIAGPISNFLLALVGGFFLKITYPFQNAFLNTFLYIFIYMNIALALFNLLPIPPLDGSHLITVFIKNQKIIAWLYSYGMFVFIGLLLIGSFFGAFNILALIIKPIVSLIFSLFSIPGFL